MNIEKIVKTKFAVIGKEGSTREGNGFIQRLWGDANGHFAEIAPLAKYNEDGTLAGIWGAMTDFTHSYLPWENGFSEGLYLAGVECQDDALPPEGWTRWDVPGFEYLRVENDAPDVFVKMLEYLKENGYTLAGAVHDYTAPATGTGYMLFPITRLTKK